MPLHRVLPIAALLVSSLLATGNASAHEPADIAPITCDSCADWNRAHAPFRLHGGSYYVGVDGLGAVLIDTGDGLVLLDGGLPQSAPVIADHIRALGFRPEDVRWIGMSHPHYDHAGGIAALVRMSGNRAIVLATQAGADALRAGNAPADDPQAGFGDEMKFPAVHTRIRVMADGETLKAGATTLRLIATPGHAPGGSSWSWQSCDGGKCLDLVYADSLNPVSAPGFRFGPPDGARVKQFQASIDRVAALPCDILVSAHPGVSQLFERQNRGQIVDASACRVYAQNARTRLQQRLAEEAAAPAAPGKDQR